MKFLGVGVSFSLLFLLLPLFFHNAQCGNLVETLPGFSGPLPFKMETGYVSVEDAELFYYFFESTGNPAVDPVIFYLYGGPGCSGLSGVFFQSGPLVFNQTDYTGGVPKLVLTPYTWIKSASIVYLDAPVGAGFSYSKTVEGWAMSDTKSARQNYKFIRQWFIENPQFIANRVYIATDSYSGYIAPLMAQHIIDHNAAGGFPYINLLGIISGSAHIDKALQTNSRIPYAHRMALISDKLFKAANESCNAWYYTISPSNTACLEAVAVIDEMLADISTKNILYPNCKQLSPKPDDVSRRVLREIEKVSDPSHKSQLKDWFCEFFHYLLVDLWGNLDVVKDALHVRKGTTGPFYRCNLTVFDINDSDIVSAVPYHKNLTDSGLQVLIYAGDHDMLIPHISSEEWIGSLNLTVETSWQPWYVDGQVAGYTVEYSNGGYRLTYATLKGSGHSPTEYKRQNCFEMYERWSHFYPL